MTQSRHLLELKVAARAEHLKAIRDGVRDALTAAGCTDPLVDDAVLAVAEACSNIIQHAYRETPGEIVLEIINNGHELLFRLTDFADPVDSACIKPRRLDELRPGGLGTHFMQSLMDEIVYARPAAGCGNQLIMKKTIR